MDAKQLEINLAQFIGTENYYKFNFFLRDAVMTDGAKYLADKAGCYWLYDILCSVQHLPKVRREEFQVLRFNKAKKLVTVEDGNYNILYSQVILSTDFPLDEIMLYFTNNVLLLPSEN